MEETRKKLNLSALKKQTVGKDIESETSKNGVKTIPLSVVEWEKNESQIEKEAIVTEETEKPLIETKTEDSSVSTKVEVAEKPGKKAMISLSSIKSANTPKEEEEKPEVADTEPSAQDSTNPTNETEEKDLSKNWNDTPTKKWEEVQQIDEAQKTEKKNNNILELEESDNNKEEELTLTPEDKTLVEEKTKQLEKDIQKDLEKQEKLEKEEEKEIIVEEDLFDNYVPKYWKEEKKKLTKEEKKKLKAEKKKLKAEKSKKVKRVRWPINKKKQKALIIAMILCIMWAGTFALLPHLSDTDDIKTNVIEASIQDTKNSVNTIIDNTNEPEANIEEEDTETVTEEQESEENEPEGIVEEKPENDRVKSYLLDNYYK